MLEQSLAQVPRSLHAPLAGMFAIAETCSHFSGPLSEGKLVGDSIVCPYHASRFALSDGHVLDGPAVHPQPCLEVRVQSGQIEVRKLPTKG